MSNIGTIRVVRRDRLQRVDASMGTVVNSLTQWGVGSQALLHGEVPPSEEDEAPDRIDRPSVEDFTTSCLWYDQRHQRPGSSSIEGLKRALDCLLPLALDVVAKFMYRINPKWDVAAGWRWTGYELDITELKNEFRSTGWIMHAAYSF